MLLLFLIKHNELGKNEKVKIKAIDIPNAIIFPNSITGFNSPKSNDKNATAVVRAAKKQGKNICSTASINDFLLSIEPFCNSLILTKT